MINRNTLNSELLSNLHGLYVDCSLMRQHIYTQFRKYFKKHFPYKGESCFKESYVMLVKFDYDKLYKDFLITITSEELLSKEEIDNFCKEFELLLKKVEVETRISDYGNRMFQEGVVDKNDESFMKYTFGRKKENMGGIFL